MGSLHLAAGLSRVGGIFTPPYPYVLPSDLRVARVPSVGGADLSFLSRSLAPTLPGVPALWIQSPFGGPSSGPAWGRRDCRATISKKIRIVQSATLVHKQLIRRTSEEPVGSSRGRSFAGVHRSARRGPEDRPKTVLALSPHRSAASRFWSSRHSLGPVECSPTARSSRPPLAPSMSARVRWRAPIQRDLNDGLPSPSLLRLF